MTGHRIKIRFFLIIWGGVKRSKKYRGGVIIFRKIIHGRGEKCSKNCRGRGENYLKNYNGRGEKKCGNNYGGGGNIFGKFRLRGGGGYEKSALRGGGGYQKPSGPVPPHTFKWDSPNSYFKLVWPLSL